MSSTKSTARSLNLRTPAPVCEIAARGPGGPRGFGQTPARLGESHPLCQLAATSLDRFTTRSYTDRGLMSRHLLAVVSLLSLALLTLACNGNGGPAASVSPTGEESPTVQPSETPTTATPSPTVSPQTTPSGTVSPTPTASPTSGPLTPTSGPLTPTSGPISAVAPADLTQYEGQTVNWEGLPVRPQNRLSPLPRPRNLRTHPTPHRPRHHLHDRHHPRKARHHPMQQPRARPDRVLRDQIKRMT